jgi:hypothetical protein
MSKLLLKEHSILTVTPELLKEYAENPEKPFTVVGVVQRADAKNQNGRIYPYTTLKKEVDRYLNEVVRPGHAIGQLDHIDSPVIELDKVSHLIEDLWWDGADGKDLYGKIRLLNTPKGQIAREIVKEGIPLGISSRAVGSVSQNEAKGADVVGEDLQLICWDLVGTPSTQHAYLKLHESYDPSKAYPKPVRIKSVLQELLKK